MDRETEAVVSNAHLRHTLLAIRQVLGEKGSKDVYKSVDLEAFLVSFPPDNLNDSIPVQEYARILQTIETTYGHEGENILRRIGRESFHLVLREQPTRMNLAKRVMGTWSKEQRLQFILESIVDAKQEMYPQADIWLEEHERTLLVIEQNCLDCYQRQSTQPVCHLTSGMIDEALLWATGQNIESRETDCIAMGDAYCRFEVNKSVPQRSST
jgi:predicted hydrocarbon binding protein